VAPVSGLGSVKLTVDGRPVRAHEDVWTLPRYSCGYNWTTPAQLLEILNAA